MARDRSVANLLREIVEEWLERAPVPDQEAAVETARRRALAAAGSIAGGDPHRAERARETLRARLSGGR